MKFSIGGSQILAFSFRFNPQGKYLTSSVSSFLVRSKNGLCDHYLSRCFFLGEAGETPTCPHRICKNVPQVTIT
jgi:hypothetical protein